MDARRLPRIIICVLGATCILGFAHPKAHAQPNRFESEIRAFERADSLQPPPKGAVLFVGSSSIAGWTTLESDFPEHQPINRGFGGSEIPDVIHFAERIVLPYEPETIVFYAGDNDIASGATPKQVAGEFLTFADVIRDALPQTRIVFIAIKPSIARGEMIDGMRTANTLIKFYARGDEQIDFVDVFTPMLDEQRRPREVLFLDDGLHMNARGYALWRRLVAPHLR